MHLYFFKQQTETKKKTDTHTKQKPLYTKKKLTIRSLFSFFVTIGWHLWTASDKENHKHTHTHKTVHTPQIKKKEKRKD
jgi:hypothetical protein